MPKTNFLSVICPVYNEEKYIKACIDSLLAQDYPKETMEIIFIDGMSNDKTRDIIHDHIKQYPYIKLLNNPDKIVPYALNLGIKEAVGDVILRIDAHSIYETNYFSMLVSSLKELNADNVGSVCKTSILNFNKKTVAIKEILSSPFGVGNSFFRTGIKKVMEVDTVPFGCWRRDVFDKYGFFDIRLKRNQDIEFNKRIKNNGGKIYIVPNTYCTYLARETYKGIAKNNFQNGEWNIFTVLFTKQFKSLSVRHFIPLLFVSSLILPICLSLLYRPFIYIFFISLFLYLTTYIPVSIKLYRENNQTTIPHLFWGFLTLHISYGLGSIVGVLKGIYKIAEK